MLDNLRRVIAYARDYENEFVQEIVGKALSEQTKQLTATKRQRSEERRVGKECGS